MADRVKIYTFVGLIVVFASLFLLSLQWREKELPQIRYCCRNKSTCDGLNEIKAGDINPNWNHNTRFKVVKGMQCDLGFYERPSFFIKKVSEVSMFRIYFWLQWLNNFVCFAERISRLFREEKWNWGLQPAAILPGTKWITDCGADMQW